MRNIIAIACLGLLFSCSPYQKMILLPVNRNMILKDSCDLLLIKQLNQSLDTIEYDQTQAQSKILEELIEESHCTYHATKVYPPHQDSSIWLVIIRPASLGKDDFILGSLYTIYPREGSTLNFKRRMKVYTQQEKFESGKYMVFSYSIKNDSTTIVKKGIGLF